MSTIWKVVKAEMTKQHKNYFYQKSIYMSLLIWPILAFFSAYYSYKPFKLNITHVEIPYLNEGNMLYYILIGFTALQFFYCFIQSAWRFSFERIYGTLELMYLTPANRMAILFGNAVASLFGSMWSFSIFSLFMLLLFKQYIVLSIGLGIVCILYLIISAIIWGMFLNSLFIVSRDSGFLYTILQVPLEFFTGVRIPVALFPLWARKISLIFPLTYIIEMLRRVFLHGSGIEAILSLFTSSLIIGIILLVLTYILLIIGEKHLKKSGTMTLF